MAVFIFFPVIISIFTSALSIFQSNEQQQLHIHSSQVEIDSAFKNKHIIIIGDSISRYLYVALVYMLHHKHWLESAMLPNPVEERTYESWPIYFGATDGMFYPYHYCDCSREQMYENKYYINRASSFFVSYLLYFGKNYPIHARWSPNSTYSSINTTTVNSNYLLDLGDTLRSCGGEISSTLSEYEYPDLPELLLQHVAKLQPNGPLERNNTNESFSNDSSTAYDSSSLYNPNKLYAIVLSAGFWPSKFHNVDYSKKVIEAALNVRSVYSRRIHVYAYKN
jgi:hypothetical protein